MKMKPEVEAYRVTSGSPWASYPGFSCGLFIVPFRSNNMKVMVYDGKADNWEHVSVSLKNRCPNWEEMSYIKNLFWDEEETVIQFHPKKSEYVNMHPYCLHLWRHKEKEFELPPSYLVGFKDKSEEQNEAASNI